MKWQHKRLASAGGGNTKIMAWNTDSQERKRRLKSILGGSAGNLVEWYDWYAYSAFTVYFAKSFFPSEDHTAQLLSAAAIFAVGFLMRPIGAWIMGTYTDRHGRKAGLALSVTLMCLGSLIIAVAPSYHQIGLAAPGLLVLARLIQGVSVGGEYGASATYLSEMAGRDHRGFYTSFQYVTLVGGQLTALAVQLILQAFMSEQTLEQWGWRIPFAIGGVLALAVYYIRRGLAETEAFTKAHRDQAEPRRSSGLALFRFYPKQAFMVMALTAGGTVAFYTYTIYLQKFLVNSAGFSRPESTRITALALFIYMLLQPLYGALSDRIGRKPLMIGFGLLGSAFTIPIFSALATTDDMLPAFLLSLAALLIVSGYTSINALVKAELFPAHIRALGVALPYALANTIFGGTAEYVALWFKQNGHEPYFFWYVTMMIMLSLVVYIMMPETKRQSMIQED
ncbi:Alpha-ketoglutarate permease [Granulibacter bethesdensis]|uniref:Alpha-ketoglutarate permease n=2 Tax=Granulibacter bethesdensis TaxID=364410 RepID=A0AAN0RFG9_9PROT|nr:Alpha-ketoglutarate permease [Granulibacter bethesdensis]AHJ65452.1 Alpha-ketoglutarate permease [Granulibacter bethesdensis CGDNIH4]AHJ68064.1 Alpha-ketoglutarate permease [Granulibacter bethesdensis]APH60414.1 Alpha-ketoglutarate permease [Granulibacter bethesdensis]